MLIISAKSFVYIKTYYAFKRKVSEYGCNCLNNFGGKLIGLVLRKTAYYPLYLLFLNIPDSCR